MTFNSQILPASETHSVEKETNDKKEHNPKPTGHETDISDEQHCEVQLKQCEHLPTEKDKETIKVINECKTKAPSLTTIECLTVDENPVSKYFGDSGFFEMAFSWLFSEGSDECQSAKQSRPSLKE